MKISKIRLIVLAILWLFYLTFVISELVRFPSFYFNGSYYLWLFRWSLYLALFSVAFVLISRAILRPLSILLGGLAGIIIIYYAFFYFYNPFVMSRHKLYEQPNGLYKIEYPSSWLVANIEKDKTAVLLKEQIKGNDPSEKWNFVRSSILVGYYSEALAWPAGLNKGVTTIEVDGRKAEARFFEDGGSTCTLVGVEVRIPFWVKDRQETFMIQVNQLYNSDNLPNPHQISPERLLKKALPLLRTFKLRQDGCGDGV